MAKFMRNTLLLAMVEVTYGVDPIPTAAANAMLVRGVTPQPLVAEFVERSLMRPYFGNSGKINVANHSEIEFEVELAGSGVAGTAPKYGPLLRACGMSETISAAVSVTYAPVTNSQESATIYYYMDGILHKLNGARGSVTIGLNAKQIPVLKFKFVGKYTAPTDTAIPAGADFSGFKTPLAVNKANVAAYTLHGVTAPLQSLDIDLANNVIFRALANDESIYITDRKPAGTASFEMTSLATKNWFTAIVASTTDALLMRIGATAGNIVEINGAKVQITNPQYQESDGIAMMNASLEFQPNIGNDEISIVVK